jgi:Uma2 family endonuclease
MNTQFRPPSMPLTTQAAEGLMRRRWSLAEIEAMVEAGVLLEDERFELIGGEVVPMSPKGNHHELLKAALIAYWVKRCPDHVHLVPETTFRINADTFHEPDFVFYLEADGLVKLSPKTAQFVVEVSDSSLGYDLHRKARLYASYGIRELWVIDAVKLVTHIHRNPGVEGYGDITEAAPTMKIAPLFASELAVVMGKLKLV